MSNRRNPRDLKLILGVIFFCLALLWSGVIFGLRKQENDLQSELAISIDKGQSVRVRELLDKGVDPKKMQNPIGGLISAVVYCDPATVEAIIKKGVNVNGKNNGGLTPLHYAIIHRRSDMVEVLLKNGANVWIKKADGDTALAAMAKPGHKLARHDNDQKIVSLLQDAERKSKK